MPLREIRSSEAQSGEAVHVEDGSVVAAQQGGRGAGTPVLVLIVILEAFPAPSAPPLGYFSALRRVDC